jgi:hypothetical protein
MKVLCHSLLHKADACLHIFLRVYPLLQRRISRLEELLVPGGGRPHLWQWPQSENKGILPLSDKTIRILT